MAYVDVIGGIVKVTMAFRPNPEQVQMMNWHLLCNNAGGTDTRLSILAKVNLDFANMLLKFYPPASKYLGSKAFVEEVVPRPVSVINPASQTGGGTVNSLPTAVRNVISFKTQFAGRRYRGRVYGFTPDDTRANVEGKPTTDVGDAWVSFFTQWVNGLTFAGSLWNLALYHPVKKGKPPPPTPVTQIEEAFNPVLFGTIHRSGDYGQANADPW